VLTRSHKYPNLWVAVFLTVYITVSLLDAGSVDWAGAIAGALGLAIAVTSVHFVRRSRKPLGRRGRELDRP
jgi:hypothetical protein